MIKTIEEGRTMTIKQVLDRHGLKAPRIAVGLDFDDMQQARVQANELGVNYEDYVRQLIHEALAKSDLA